jgi:hypothetical protein
VRQKWFFAGLRPTKSKACNGSTSTSRTGKSRSLKRRRRTPADIPMSTTRRHGLRLTRSTPAQCIRANPSALATDSTSGGLPPVFRSGPGAQCGIRSVHTTTPSTTTPALPRPASDITKTRARCSNTARTGEAKGGGSVLGHHAGGLRQGHAYGNADAENWRDVLGSADHFLGHELRSLAAPSRRRLSCHRRGIRP